MLRNDNGARGDFSAGIDWGEAQAIVYRAVDELTKGGRQFVGAHSIDDLRQEGMEAILRASENFDERRLVPFPQYARKAVSYALLRYLRSTDPLPERSRRDLRKIQNAEFAFLEQGIENPTTLDISRATGLPQHRVVRVKREAYQSAPQALDDPQRRTDFPGLSGDTPEDRYILWESRERIHKALSSLTVRQREVFQLRFIENMNVGQISDTLGISKGRVSQISASVENLLRTALEG